MSDIDQLNSIESVNGGSVCEYHLNHSPLDNKLIATETMKEFFETNFPEHDYKKFLMWFCDQKGKNI